LRGCAAFHASQLLTDSKTLKVTPAMEAGITDHGWTIDELCALLPKPTANKSTIEDELTLKVLSEMA
jgi:hypothetical protein